MNSDVSPDLDLLKIKDVAAMLKMSTSWVSKGQPHHDIPKIYLSPRGTRGLRFRRSDVEAFIERRIAESHAKADRATPRLAPVGRGRRSA